MLGETLNSNRINVMLGKTLGDRYHVIKHLGGGGFGQTYLVEDWQLPGNPLFVAKHLKPKSNDPETLQTARVLFNREAQVLYKLGNHNQIPQLFADFEEDEEFYLVQEYIEGHDLKQELPIGQPLTETQAIALLKDILEILEFVHQESVIHRDIKPSNLIRRKQDGKIVLIDFGAVKQVSTHIANPNQQTTITIAIGSPGYMPNEQICGKPRFCSDIYAVGILGIQALTGIPACQLPEDPRTSELVWRERLPIEIQHTLPLLDVLDKMVRYDYRQRYQTVTEALQAIRWLNTSNKLRQVNSVATHTLTLKDTPAHSAITATLPPQTLPSVSQDSSQEPQADITTPRNKSGRLLGMGTGIATVLALMVGINQFPNLKSLGNNGQTVTYVNTLTGHSKEVYSIAISPDGQILASGSRDNTVKLWNLPNREPLHTLRGHSDKVVSVAISPDGEALASGSADKTIKLWNRKTGQLLHTLTGHSNIVLSVAISPDGQTLASSSADETIKLWNLHTGKLLHTLKGHSGWVRSVAFSPDGKILADGSDDRTIKLWHLPTGKLINTIADPSGNVVRSVAFSPDGQTLVTGSLDSVNLWNLSNVLTSCKQTQGCKPTRTLEGNLGIVETVSISPDSQAIAASGSKKKTILVWNGQTGKLTSALNDLSGTVASLTFSPDGKTLISSGSEDGAIEIWRAHQQSKKF